MSKLAIIPARGGSKRIPRKNIKHFAGKPIIAYSIEIALKSNLFDEVMVSTDDAEIAEIAISYGAKVPFMRSVSTSDHFATTYDVIEDVIESYKLKGIKFDLACCIYATAPFITIDKLNESFDLLNKGCFDCVFPVVKYGFPIQRSCHMDSESGKMELLYPEKLNERSQDLEATYHDSGQFYSFNIKKIEKEKALWTNNSGIIEIDELQAQDIDTEVDWKLAELKYELLQRIK